MEKKHSTLFRPLVAVGPRPFWSVVVPTYEPQEPFLQQALESVLKQVRTSEHMQIHVVDDCSPNVDVASMVDRIAGNRVTFSRNDSNQGLAGCWNQCLAKSSGQWVHLLHQDDQVLPGFYTCLERFIEQHPEAGAAFCRCNYMDGDGQIVGEQENLQEVDGILHGGVCQLAMRNEIQCPGIVVKRYTYEQLGGFNSDYKFVVDWEMWLRIASRFQVLYTSQKLASFRIQKNSETARLARSAENVYDAVKLIDSFGLYVPPQELFRTQRSAKKWTSDLALRRTYEYLKDGNASCAMSQLKAVLAIDGSRANWKQALRLWIRAMRLSKTLIPPPFPMRKRSVNGT